MLLLLGVQRDEAGTILSAFGPGLGMLLLSSAQNWLHLSLGRADRAFRWNLVVLVASVAALIVGLPFGPVGVALAYSCSLVLLLAPGFAYAGRPIELTLPQVLPVVWRYIAAAGIAGTFSWYVLRGSTVTASIYTDLPVLARVPVAFAVCAWAYLGSVVAMYGGMSPLSKIFTLLREVALWRTSRGDDR